MLGIEPRNEVSKAPMIPFHHTQLFAQEAGFEPAVSPLTGERIANYATPVYLKNFLGKKFA